MLPYWVVAVAFILMFGISLYRFVCCRKVPISQLPSTLRGVAAAISIGAFIVLAVLLFRSHS
jgi:hypothetical protein